MTWSMMASGDWVRGRYLSEKYTSAWMLPQPGGAFVFVNDHDPKPLYYQLEAEHPKQFSWAYLESGPVAWKVKIGRLPQ